MKRVGVITMHRVMNVGSVLQSYALCEKLSQLGANAEIIDYQYPNRFHKQDVSSLSFAKKIILFPHRVKYYLLYRSKIQKARFRQFIAQRIPMSKYYPDRESIYNAPPQYDIFMTGSDQVWNPKCMNGDSVFLCDFAKSGMKVSYSASFTVADIPDSLKHVYSDALKTYKYIGVRESSAVGLVDKLSGKEATMVCDPTLLLTKEDYIKLAADSAFDKDRDPYILVYPLSYAFDPYPQIDEVVSEVKKQLGYKVIYLHANSVEHFHIGKSITSAGPAEFVDLFLNAKFVITSSFHGTAFAINFEIPFISVVPEDMDQDSRIMSLLKTMNLTQQAIKTMQKLPSPLNLYVDYEIARNSLSEYRRLSEEFLMSIIEDDNG